MNNKKSSRQFTQALEQLNLKFQGCLVGSALGDAFGYPFECVSVSERASLMKRLTERSEAKGTWAFSDDTQMLIDVTRSILESGGFLLETQMKWLRRGYDPARGYGKGMKLIFRAMDQGVEPSSLHRTAWREGSKGNGGITRLPGLLCFYYLDDRVEDQARQSCGATHSHREALEASVLYTRILHTCLSESNPENFSPQSLLSGLLQGISESSPFREKFAWIQQALQRPHSAEDAPRTLGNGTLALESLSLALYALCMKPLNPADAIVFAASLGGDTDSIGALVGGMIGALHGLSAFPDRWLENLKEGQELQSLGTTLFEAWLDKFLGVNINRA